MINSLWVEETRQTVNKFQKRCEEILSICELVKIFDSFQGNDHSSNLINSIVTYKLQHELTGFKSTFFLMLCPIQEIVTEIFDVDSNKWIHVNDIFQYEFAALSIEMENALNESFSLVGNIEDALDALSFVNNYYNIPSLRQSFVNNVKNAREIFQEDMANAMLQNAVNSEYTENAVEILMKKQRMEVLHQRIQNCNYHDYETDEKYRLMIEYLNENIEYEFQKWTNEFESNIKRRFERPLIAKCFYKNGLYETNIDRKVLEMYKQRKIWIEIGVLIADEMDLWIGMEKYLIIYGHVQRIVMLYNKMIAGLTLSENELFQELIGKCEYAMKPGISVICWNSSESFKYAEWTSHYLNKMWKIIDNFKKRNLEMIEICELISNSHHHLLSLKQSWCKSLSNLKDNFEVQRLRVVRSVIQYYNEICKNLFHIRKTLTKYIPKVENVWKKYLEKWDNLVDRLLKMLIESVLTHAKNEFEADQLNRNVLITINVSIQNNRMAMSPSISEIMSFISNMLENLSRPLELVPRILSKFEYQSASQTYGQSILADIYIANIQTNIIYVTERMLEECKNWLLEWKKFRYVWKTSYNELKMNKDKEFIKTEISRNLEVIDTVNWMCEIEIRGMFLVNAEEVKLQIVNICKNNINQLSLLLQK